MTTVRSMLQKETSGTIESSNNIHLFDISIVGINQTFQRTSFRNYNNNPKGWRENAYFKK